MVVLLSDVFSFDMLDIVRPPLLDQRDISIALEVTRNLDLENVQTNEKTIISFNNFTAVSIMQPNGILCHRNGFH